jgi:glycosyltransferase involved in cell wall biosynthesis
MKISACLIACNEELNLPRCLASVGPVVDEIIVVDSGSTDKTQKIASTYNARFISKDWSGYVAQKNFALDQAVHPWILSIDADEELSPELADSIRRLREHPPADPPSGYLFSRLVSYRGRWIRHGDWYPDFLVRLFQKKWGHFAGGQVHERLQIEGETKKLDGFLHHYTYLDRVDREARIARYAELWAASAHEQGICAQPWTPAVHAIARFIRGSLVRGGFLDGPIGFEIACGNAREVYLKYHHLRKLNGQ